MHQVGREILIFELGGRRYGLPAATVLELVRAVAIEPLPLAPPIVEGVMNLRGVVVPIVDLRGRLGLPAKDVELADHLVICQVREALLAIRVDHALELVKADAIEGESAAARSPGRTPVATVARQADGLVPVIDLLVLLTEEEREAIGAFAPPTPIRGGEEEE